MPLRPNSPAKPKKKKRDEDFLEVYGLLAIIPSRLDLEGVERYQTLRKQGGPILQSLRQAIEPIQLPMCLDN